MTAALSLVLAGGVVTAAYRSFRTTTAPAALIPSSAFAALTIDLSAPDGQAAALSTFADHFPGSPTRTGDGSAVDRLLRAAFHDSQDPHLDYDKDVKPWLGDHLAAAGWIDGDNHPRAEYIVEVRDEDAARNALEKLSAATGGSPPGFVMAHGYAVLADTTAQAREAVSAADASALAGDGHFSGDVDRLPSGEPVVGWLDGPGVKQALGSALGPDAKDLLGSAGMFGGTGVFGFSPGAAFKGRVAAGIRFADNYAQLDVLQIGAAAPSTSASSRLTDLPAGTIGALEIGDPGPLVDGVTALLKTFAGFGGVSVNACASTGNLGPASAQPGGYSSDLSCSFDPPPPLDPFEEFTKATGLTLPDDVKALLGDGTVIVYGGVELGGLPDVAIRSHPTNLAAARDLAQRFADTVERATGFHVVVETAGDDLVLASSSSYAESIRAKGSLGDQRRATTALGDIPAEVAVAGYIDLSRIWPLAGGDVPAEVRHLEAIGFWGDVAGAVQHLQLRVVVG
jgi:hypothetical protein